MLSVKKEQIGELWDKIFLPHLKDEQWVIFRPKPIDNRKDWPEYKREMLGRISRFNEVTDSRDYYWVVVRSLDYSYHTPLRAYREELTPIRKPDLYKVLRFVLKNWWKRVRNLDSLDD